VAVIRQAVARLAAILKRHPADILHLYFTGFLIPYPWVARVRGVKKVFFTDHGSHPEGYVAARRPGWKRAARALNFPLDGVICINDYNARSMRTRDTINPATVQRIYNRVDLAAVHGYGAEFRLRHTVPPKAPTVDQASWMIQTRALQTWWKPRAL
jgi:Glycosyltransferase Family 4